MIRLKVEIAPPPPRAKIAPPPPRAFTTTTDEIALYDDSAIDNELAISYDTWLNVYYLLITDQM